MKKYYVIIWKKSREIYFDYSKNPMAVFTNSKVAKKWIQKLWGQKWRKELEIKPFIIKPIISHKEITKNIKELKRMEVF